MHLPMFSCCCVFDVAATRGYGGMEAWKLQIDSVLCCLVEFEFDLFVQNLLKIKDGAESTCQCPGRGEKNITKYPQAGHIVNNT